MRYSLAASASEQLAAQLISIYCDVEELIGSPYGYMLMDNEEHDRIARRFFEFLIDRIKQSVDVDTVTDEVTYILEDENFHSLNRAIAIAQRKISINDVLQYYRSKK